MLDREDLRRRISERLQEARLNRKEVTPPPRYDDVFFEGVAWLNGECDSIEEEQGPSSRK